MEQSRELRNRQFREKYPLIELVLRRHYRLIRACRMSGEDLRQDLSVRMLRDLERYNPRRCPNLDAYLRQRLNFEVLHQATPGKRYGIPGAPLDLSFRVLSLDAKNRDGHTLTVPCPDEQLASLWLRHEIAALPDNQRIAINKRLSGKQVRSGNKALEGARCHLKARMADVGIIHGDMKGGSPHAKNGV